VSITASALLGMALAHDSVGPVILWSCIASVGVGAAFAAIPNLIVGAVDEHETGEATGVNTVMRNIGSAVGAQVAGTIIATHVLASGLPARARDSGSPRTPPASTRAHQGDATRC